ncbi:YceI family protein [Ancylobacter oerskovii]|uniref:YceI family protein n=1 Tax=Ancylobacter oerskovii TaxID=459519 RepID=A0ABW4YT95_9HYPH|nr:YceI family protein [Ancylobacter oerskovii]MBS7543430.1 YceI family protein [Ancylobacter oerskovii]
MRQVAPRGFAVAALLLLAGLPLRADSYRIDPAQTEIAFEIGAKGYPLTHGVFHRFNSQLTIDLDRPQRSSVRFSVAAASLDTRSPALDTYVRGPAFLDSDRHPDIRFTSTSVEKLDDRSVRVTGNMTLLGTTRPESVVVEVRHNGAHGFSFHATFGVRRSLYGMTAGLPLVSDDVRIIVAAHADGT